MAGGFLIPADGVAKGLPAHDAAHAAQHDSLSAQMAVLQTAVANLTSSGDHSGLPPTWDKVLPANDPGGPCPANSSRFTCVMGGAAVRDNETGLVWEQSPGNTAVVWGVAQNTCSRSRATGGRMGWRLPSVAELGSLVDPSVVQDLSSPFPLLPPGHPFSSIQFLEGYWTATTQGFFPTIAEFFPSFAWRVHFGLGLSNAQSKLSFGFVWCVRGGMNADIY
jgi:hypothetical protein